MECTRAKMSLRPDERAHGPDARATVVRERLSRVLAAGTHHRGARTGGPATDHALGMPEVVISILEAIDASDPESACKTAAQWCGTNSDHRNVCNGNPDAWETLMNLVFPNTARLQKILAGVPNSDPHKVFVGLCNTKTILRVVYAYHVYTTLDAHLLYAYENGYVGEDMRRSATERLRIFDAFRKNAAEWEQTAIRDLNNLRSSDPSRRPYYLVLDDVEPPLWRIMDAVKMKSSYAIGWTTDIRHLSIRTNVEKFVFDVSIEDKKKAMEALIDTCVEVVLDLLETGQVSPISDEGLREAVKKKLRAPFTKAVEQLPLDESDDSEVDSVLG